VQKDSLLSPAPIMPRSYALIQPGTGYQLTNAININDRGEILAKAAQLDCKVTHVAIWKNGELIARACNKAKMMPILRYLLDENEFFGPHGIRLLSRYHRSHPFRFCIA